MEKFILLPPGLHALAALVAVDDENEDGLPEGKYQLGGVQITQDDGAVMVEATNGRIAGRYRASIRKRRDGTSAVPLIESPQRFPNFEAVLPSGPPAASFALLPENLVPLLRACQAVSGFSGQVILEFYGPGKPLVLRAKNEYRGREFTGMLAAMAATKEGRDNDPEKI